MSDYCPMSRENVGSPAHGLVSTTLKVRGSCTRFPRPTYASRRDLPYRTWPIMLFFDNQRYPANSHWIKKQRMPFERRRHRDKTFQSHQTFIHSLQFPPFHPPPCTKPSGSGEKKKRQTKNDPNPLQTATSHSCPHSVRSVSVIKKYK